MTSITRRYTFEAAHWLPKVPDGHKCRRVHGHNYEIEVTVAGQVREDGFVMDFAELDQFVRPLVAEIDHRTLNDIKGLENPTAELIAEWFYDRLGPVSLHGLLIRVYETKDCWAAFP